MSAGLIAGSIAAPIVGGLAGQYFSRGDKSRQDAAMQSALGVLAAIPDPDLKKIKYEEMVSQGIFTPEMQYAIEQQDTELGGIQLDPALRQAQMGALAGLQERAEGGLTLTDRARLNEVLGEQAAAAKGMREAGQLQAQRRGVGGGGAELASALQAQQEAAGRGAQETLGVADMAQRSALESLMMGGQLAGQVGQQDYGRAAEAAQAQDVINAANIANQRGVQDVNVGMRNMAALGNLQEKQRLHEGNIGLRNEAQMHNKYTMPMAQFQARLNKAGMQSGAYGNQAGMYGQRAAGTQAMWGGMGQGVGKGLGAYGQYQAGKKS